MKKKQQQTNKENDHPMSYLHLSSITLTYNHAVLIKCINSNEGIK